MDVRHPKHLACVSWFPQLAGEERSTFFCPQRLTETDGGDWVNLMTFGKADGSETDGATEYENILGDNKCLTLDMRKSLNIQQSDL